MNTCGGFLCHAEALKKHKIINQKNETQTKVRMTGRIRLQNEDILVNHCNQ